VIITILATVVVLGVLIFVHELGHFVTAKLVGIEVPRFSIGLGPKLVGFKRGETEYVISWLPLGGYVKMRGLEELETIEGGPDQGLARRGKGVGPRDFESKSLPARTLVISAGVIMNLLFAVLVWAGIAMVWGVRLPFEPVFADVTEEELPPEGRPFLDVPSGARVLSVDGKEVEDWNDVQRIIATAAPGREVTVRFADVAPVSFTVPESDSARASLAAALEPVLPMESVIGQVNPASPAAEAGIRAGDRVVEAEGVPVERWQQFVDVVEHRPGEAVELVVERDGERRTLTVVPQPVDVPATGGAMQVGRIGVGAAIAASAAVPRDRKGPVAALGYGLDQTWFVTEMIWDFLSGLFTGRASPRDVGGPILIAQLSSQMAQIGLEAFLNFMALFSVNLAILNLLPIPILDGGQLVFLGVEAVRGRALSWEQRMRLSQLGLVIVVAIMVWALANDVLRLFGL